MMKLHWDKLQPAKLRNTMWNDVITDVADEYRLVDEDKQELERSFAAKQAGPSTPRVSLPDQDAEMASPTNEPLVVEVLEPNKKMMIGIKAKRLDQHNLSTHDLASFIQDGDMTAFCEAVEDDTRIEIFKTLRELRDFVGDAEQVTIRDTPPEKLGLVERMLQPLMDDSFPLKLKICESRLTFNDKCTSIETSAATLKKASCAIDVSIRFGAMKHVLSHTLALGNYINGGTTKGGAFGFKLESLSKLRSMKSNEGNSTLLNFLASILVKRHGEEDADFAGNLAACLGDVAEAAAELGDNEKTAWQATEVRIQEVQREIDAARALGDRLGDCPFVRSVCDPQYLEAAEAKCAELRQRQADAKQSASKLLKDLQGEAWPSDHFALFQTLQNFVLELREAQDANKKAVELAEVKKRREEAEERAREAQAAAHATAAVQQAVDQTYNPQQMATPAFKLQAALAAQAMAAAAARQDDDAEDAWGDEDD